MKVTVDRGTCQGYGNCVLAADDVFDLDADGMAIVVEPHPSEERRAAVEEAVRSCPVAAIALEG